MGRTTRGISLLLLVAPAFLFGGPAIAQEPIDPVEIADRLVEAMTDGTRTATYETVTGSPDGGIVIAGFAVADDENGIFANVAEITIVNPVIRETDFIAETIRLVDGMITDEANRIEWELVELADVIVPPLADLAAEAGPEIPLTAVAVQNLLFAPPQANDVTIEAVDLRLGEVIEGVPYAVEMTITGIEVPTDFADNSDAFAILADMGFEALVMDFNIVGTFDAENDTLFAESIGINIHDFGHLDVSGVFTGLPLGMLQAPGGIDELLASAMVESVRIHFVNEGAMEAFMRIQAEAMGVPPEDAAPALAVAFQILLGAFDNPELAQQVGVAVGAFLRNPQTLTIVAEPPEPVPLLAIIPLVVSNPNALPTLLQVVVTANE